MKNLLKKIVKHKIISGIILVCLIAIGLWKFGVFNKSEQTQYVLAAVEKGTIVSSVSNSGQISAQNEISIKSKASGDVIYVGPTGGQAVNTGGLLIKLDSSNAQDAVQTAKDNLAQAQTDLEKMKGITTDIGTLRGIKEKAQADLDKAYEDGFNSASNTYLGLPTVMSGLQSILFSYTYSSGSWNMDYYVNAVKDYDQKIIQYRNDAYTKYQAARTAYDNNFQEYKSTSRSSDEKTIEALIKNTYETVKTVADAVKSANNLIQFYQDTLTTRGYTPQTLSNTHLSSLNTYTGNTNSYLSALLSAKTTIQSDKETLIETDYTISDQEDTIKNLENTLKEAEDNLANYTIYSPSAGIISAVNVEKGDSVSNGTVVATLISKQQIAKISLNEVDATKVKVGQKVTVTFDAIEGLDITGKVAEVDTVGTVSQGVVSYNVQISLDTQDDRVKPGMSISASIITDAKQDVLLVPSTAIKTTNGQSVVQVIDASAIENKNSTRQYVKNYSETANSYNWIIRRHINRNFKRTQRRGHNNCKNCYCIFNDNISDGNKQRRG